MFRLTLCIFKKSASNIRLLKNVARTFNELRVKYWLLIGYSYYWLYKFCQQRKNKERETICLISLFLYCFIFSVNNSSNLDSKLLRFSIQYFCSTSTKSYLKCVYTHNFLSVRIWVILAWMYSFLVIAYVLYEI